MELGATVCTAKNPSCSTCPVQASCLARKLVASANPAPRLLDGTSTDGAKSSDAPPSVSEACGCTVCEVTGGGLAVLPLAVTEFPRKAAKT